MNKERCSICGKVEDKKNIKYLDIFVNGSEGINVCWSCRILMAEFARALQSVASRSKLNTLKEMKKRT